MVKLYNRTTVDRHVKATNDYDHHVETQIGTSVCAVSVCVLPASGTYVPAFFLSTASCSFNELCSCWWPGCRIFKSEIYTFQYGTAWLQSACSLPCIKHLCASATFDALFLLPMCTCALHVLTWFDLPMFFDQNDSTSTIYIWFMFGLFGLPQMNQLIVAQPSLRAAFRI